MGFKVKVNLKRCHFGALKSPCYKCSSAGHFTGDYLLGGPMLVLIGLCHFGI